MPPAFGGQPQSPSPSASRLGSGGLRCGVSSICQVTLPDLGAELPVGSSGNCWGTGEGGHFRGVCGRPSGTFSPQAIAAGAGAIAHEKRRGTLSVSLRGLLSPPCPLPPPRSRVLLSAFSPQGPCVLSSFLVVGGGVCGVSWTGKLGKRRQV